MDANCIDYAATGTFSPTVIHYLQDKDFLRPFYNFRPDLDGFGKLIAEKKNNPNREILVEVLQDQYAAISTSALTTQNISALLNENTYTITTGHQLNIFTGPLYFIYKIVTAIKLAHDLKIAFPDKEFVPVYWMASEDHDFAEINHTHIGHKTISWTQEVSGATGRLLTAGIEKALQEYTGILGIGNHTAQLTELVQTAYTKFNKLSDATRYLVNGLFGEYGLVILDADERRLKQPFAPYMQKDIIGQHSFENINQSSAGLQKLNVHTQVNAREINFFYLEKDLRERIVFEEGRYRVMHTEQSFSEEELLLEISQRPEKFSPNVVMRPLYQEVVLPNLAYIGGGAEVVYWLQLKINFDFYGVDFPILILRNSALLVRKSQATKINMIGFEPADFFKASGILKTAWVKEHSIHQLNLADELRDLRCVFERMKLRAFKIDPTLGPATEAIKTRMERAISNLEKKLIKAEKHHYESRLSQIDTIKDQLFPNQSLQERVENFGLYYAAWGQPLIDELIRNFHPLEFKFTVLTEA
ncbi:MAG: bacillithiol biosynthesis cysteine-adding enzyme BshC [Sphingobacteriaceae bacterium]